jgi:hypothetical protein
MSISRAYGSYNTQRQKQYFDWIGRQFGVEKPEDWYKISSSSVNKHPLAVPILRQYKGFANALQALYPEVKWNFHQHKRLSPRYWSSKQNQKEYFQILEEKFNIQKPEDWSRIPSSTLKKDPHAASIINNYYSGSLHDTLVALYPHTNWDSIQFSKIKRAQCLNHRQYFDWLANELKIKKHEEWHQVTAEMIKKYPHGSSVLAQYGGSLHTALSSVYPEATWDALIWSKVPKNYWKEIQHRRKYFDDISKQLHIQKLEDWYNISFRRALQCRGVAWIVNEYYQGSLRRALVDVYPEMQWQPWKFTPMPKHIWKEPQVVRSYLHEISTQFGVTSSREWLQLTQPELHLAASAKQLLKYYKNNWQRVLHSAFPQLHWIELLSNRMSSIERRTLECLKVFFADSEILCYCQFDFGQLDFYIPKHSIAFEVNGEQHYQPTFFSRYQLAKKRDYLKLRTCAERGITLIQIGYWWDGAPHSLFTKIHRLRPDIKLSKHSCSIS